MTETTETTTWLFDVDGTLCLPRETIHPDCLAQLLPRHDWALTSGSDYNLIVEQVLLPLRDAGWRGRAFVYASGGAEEWMVDSSDSRGGRPILTGTPLSKSSLSAAIGGGERLMAELRLVLEDYPLPAALACPYGYNTIIDRGCLWNIVPMGRPTALAITEAELIRRAAFVTHDHVTNYRQVVRARLAEVCQRINGDLRVRLGGQTGFDIQLAGIDKSHAVKRCLARGPVVFVGDAFGPYGNDQPVIDYTRTNPEVPLVVVETDGPEMTAALLMLPTNWGTK